MSLEVLAIALGGLAIVVSAIAIAFEVAFYRWQRTQGKRIGMSVISTVDQIYRRIRVAIEAGSGESTEEEGDSEYDGLHASCTPRFINAGDRMILGLSCDEESEFAQITCVVERPSGKEDRITKELTLKGQPLALRLPYPSSDFQGSTSEPGRYHVRWRATGYQLVVEVATGEERRHDCWRGSIEDAFGVLP